MEDKLATQPFFWAEYQSFIDMQKVYTEKTKELEEELRNQENMEMSHFEHLVKRLRDRMTDIEVQEKMADLCMKECHSIMIIGWEDDKYIL